ncbi:hypothetical protein NESM_000434700 [Novymonas esmeraldas]|uniref:Uncharacterized protein n=1 Tax=Novymonas esmeraldas TaxID=1808958 RepID=A0AAW0ENS1_9TRYP
MSERVGTSSSSRASHGSGGSEGDARGSSDNASERRRLDAAQRGAGSGTGGGGGGGIHARNTSSHILSQPRDTSVTMTGHSSSSSSPPVTPLSRGAAAAAAAAAAGGAAPRPVAARLRSSDGSGTPPRAAAAAVHDVRDTAEYRAAWDLELWKAVQADRFRRELERQRGTAFADLDRLVKRREKEARAAVQQRSAAVALREEVVQAEEARVAERQQRVAEMEKDLRRTRQQLLDAQQRVEDEVRAQVRLANDTIAHRARLLEERVRAAEAQAKRADERQRQAQQEYLNLYEAFSRFRSQQLTTTNSSSSSGGGGGGVTSQVLQLEQLRVQWEAEHQLQLDKLTQRHTTEMAAAQLRCRELEEQNRRLSAALVRRRERLRRTSADDGAPPSSPPPPPLSSPALLLPDAAQTTTTTTTATRAFVERTTRELTRLETERQSLVEGSSGALRESDAVIVSIDGRIHELRSHLSVVASTA